MTKRILLLIKGLGRGGAEQLLVNAASYFDRASFDFEAAYLLPWKDALVEDLEALGIPAHCLRGARGVGWIGRLRRLVREREIDLVHSHSPYVAIGARLSLGSEFPRVYTEHNLWDRYHRATYWANVLTFPRSTHVLTVSDRVRESIRYPKPLRFLPMPRVETLYHGIDPRAVANWNGSHSVRKELGIPDDAPIVGTVANLKHHKGLEFLLEAALRVRRAIPETRFVIVGRGPAEVDLRRRARRLQLDETVIFTGYRADAPRVAGSFDVFAMSSVHEGLSIALIEAMALARPAVVTRAGGLPEVVRDGKEGFIVPPRDPGALAEAIVTLLRDPVLRKSMGEEAQHRAREFDIRKAVRRMEEIYRSLLP